MVKKSGLNRKMDHLINVGVDVGDQVVYAVAAHRDDGKFWVGSVSTASLAGFQR